MYGELLGKATWSEYMFLLFRGERPTTSQAYLLEQLAIGIANLGPREASIRAAMSAGVGGSTWAASLSAALAVGAGQLGGAREVRIVLEILIERGCDAQGFLATLPATNGAPAPKSQVEDTWLPIEHVPGFDPHGQDCPQSLRLFLEHLSAHSPGDVLPWLQNHREELEARIGSPLALTGIAAAAFHDLGMSPDQAELFFLILRLPGAAVHALEQRELGWRMFPFYRNAVELLDDPGPVAKIEDQFGDSEL